jgi:acetyl esterase/lipase
MRRVTGLLVISGALVLLGGTPPRADEAAVPSRTRDVIYGRKFGLALTMEVFAPKTGNGLGIIHVVSGGWFSRPENVRPPYYTEFLRRGYTVFAVVHGSQPKFTIPEILEDLHRAVRFIRSHADEYKIDPDRLAIFGTSAGGHLSLMQGTAGLPGDRRARDPVDRVSSRVQAVASFFPPTDFLHWGDEGRELNVRTLQAPFTAAVDFKEYDRGKALYLPVTDEEKVRTILRKISPITHVSPDDPPTLLLHGDEDPLVPLQQSKIILARFKEAGVPADLIVRKGAGHGWLTMIDDMKLCADWFDKYLGKPADRKPAEVKGEEKKARPGRPPEGGK